MTWPRTLTRATAAFSAAVAIATLGGCVVTRPDGIHPEVELRPLDAGWEPELRVGLFDPRQWYRTELDTRFDVVVWGLTGGTSWLDADASAYYVVRVTNGGPSPVSAFLSDADDARAAAEVPPGGTAEVWMRNDPALHPPRVGNVIRHDVQITRGTERRAFPFVFEVAKVRRAL